LALSRRATHPKSPTGPKSLGATQNGCRPAGDLKVARRRRSIGLPISGLPVVFAELTRRIHGEDGAQTGGDRLQASPGQPDDIARQELGLRHPTNWCGRGDVLPSARRGPCCGRITALLHAAGWLVNRKWVGRIGDARVSSCQGSHPGREASALPTAFPSSSARRGRTATELTTSERVAPVTGAGLRALCRR
jgi:hypothetical protein